MNTLPKVYFREWRLWANLTQEECAARMKISLTQLSRVETGKRSFNDRFMYKFSLATECGHWSAPLVGPPDLTYVLFAHPEFQDLYQKVQAEQQKRTTRRAIGRPQAKGSRSRSTAD